FVPTVTNVDPPPGTGKGCGGVRSGRGPPGAAEACRVAAPPHPEVGTLAGSGAARVYDRSAVTFAQLQSFSTVARTGSVKAAAVELGVSEPAVSGAVAALRRELGDELFVRRGGRLVLTRGGTRLAAVAAEVLGL